MGAYFSKQPPVVQEIQAKEPPYDFYRCSPLRYMGFTSVILSKMVPPNFSQIPQMAATAYIFSDVFNKTLASVENEEDPHRTAVTAVDALLWHTMATVIAPLLLFGSLKSATKLIFLRKPTRPPPIKPAPTPTATTPAPPIKKDPCAPRPLTPPPKSQPIKPLLGQTQMQAKPEPALVSFLPGLIALMLTPFVVEPIQDTVDDVMDATFRKWSAGYLERNELSLEERRERAKAKKLAQEQAAKEAEERRKAEEERKEAERQEAVRIAAEKAAQIAKEKADAEAAVKAKAKEKCLEEEKLRKEKVLAEERALKEKIEKEEKILAEKKSKIEKELKEKADKTMDCD